MIRLPYSFFASLMNSLSVSPGFVHTEPEDALKGGVDGRNPEDLPQVPIVASGADLNEFCCTAGNSMIQVIAWPVRTV